MAELTPQQEWLKEVSGGVRTLATGVVLIGAFAPFAASFAEPSQPFNWLLALLSVCLGGTLFLAAQDLFLRAYE